MALLLKEKYNEEIVPALQDLLKLENVMQVPRVEKVVLNIGLGEALENAKALDAAVEDLTKIAGQKPVVTISRKNIANFKLREGRAIGTKVSACCNDPWRLRRRVAKHDSIKRRSRLDEMRASGLGQLKFWVRLMGQESIVPSTRSEGPLGQLTPDPLTEN